MLASVADFPTQPSPVGTIFAEGASDNASMTPDPEADAGYPIAHFAAMHPDYTMPLGVGYIWICGEPTSRCGDPLVCSATGGRRSASPVRLTPPPIPQPAAQAEKETGAEAPRSQNAAGGKTAGGWQLSSGWDFFAGGWWLEARSWKLKLLAGETPINSEHPQNKSRMFQGDFRKFSK